MVLYLFTTCIVVFGLLVIFLCNWRIIKVVNRHKRQITTVRIDANSQNNSMFNNEWERKQTNVTIILVSVFLICYLPALVKYQFIAFDILPMDNSNILILLMWLDFLLFVNSLANPILYYFRLQSIRKAMYETLAHIKAVLCRNGNHD